MDASSPTQSSQATPVANAAPSSSNSMPTPVAVSSTATPSPKQPSTTNKGMIAAIIIVVIVVVGVAVYAFMSKQSPSNSDSQNAMTVQVSRAPKMSQMPSQAMPSNQGSQGNGLTSGTTNENLTQDSNTLTKQLDSASSEMNGADQGLNDKPADLSQ